MRRFFAPNIDGTGRIVRAAFALALLLGAAVAFRFSAVAAMVLLGSGVFVLVEALRGWCAFRACGIRTKL